MDKEEVMRLHEELRDSKDFKFLLYVMKNCERCWKEFPTKWPKKYCLACSKIINKEQQERWRATHKK